MNRSRTIGATLVASALGALSLVPVAVAGPAVDTASTTTAVASSSVSLLSTSAVSYADVVVRAWGRGDRATVGSLATRATAEAMFDYATPGGVHWRRIGAEGAAGTVFTTYVDDARGGTMTLGVSNVILDMGGTHAAYTVRFSRAHPISPAEYADRLVRAWGRGDEPAMQVYATTTVVATLLHHADPGGQTWRRTFADGAAGTTYVTYRDQTGHRLVLGVDNASEASGHFRSVRLAHFG